MPTNILDTPTNAITPTRSSSLSPPTTDAGWETFVSDDLQVAVDYPPDWSVNESASGVTFTSPTGFSIQLAEVDTGDLSPEEFLGENQLPNTHCSTIENAYGVQALVCLDTLSRSYSAYFVVTPSQGAPRLLSLSMLGKSDNEVFDRMVGSLRPSAGP